MSPSAHRTTRPWSVSVRRTDFRPLAGDRQVRTPGHRSPSTVLLAVVDHDRGGSGALQRHRAGVEDATPFAPVHHDTTNGPIPNSVAISRTRHHASASSMETRGDGSDRARCRTMLYLQ